MAVKKGKEVMTSGSSSSKDVAGVKRKKVMASKGEGSGKKLKRAGVLRFIDETAEIAEEDEDSDGLNFIDDLGDNDDADNNGGFVNELKPGLKDAKSSGGRSHHLNFFLKEEDLTVEEHEQLIKERYSGHVNYEEETKQTDEIFLPSSKDLDIWRVKCMVGREQQITTSIFQKFVDMHTFGTKLAIVSVFALEHAKGCIFVEAEKEADVTEACKGFCNLYSTRKTLITKDEFPRLLSIKSISNGLSKGTWVRVKNGNYKGDLAQVVAVDDQHKRVMLRLIPRIDLQALAKKFGGGVSLKESGVPAPRLISSRELEDFRPHIQLKRDRLTGEHFEILDGLMLKEGYLYKKVSLVSISWSGIQPSKNELLKFEAAKVNDAEDLNWLSLVYGDRKKVQQEPERGAENNRGSGYEVHDLVLFGRKDFGVIIGVKGESIQILKGDSDTEEQKLATVLRKEIKNVCADKMFTASDRHMKTVCISDCVKVLEGPLEGREGTVRHMYKGFLFVYDETQSENCGYICVKSQLCTNTRKSKYSKSGVKSDKAGCSSSYLDAGESMDSEATDTRESDDNARRSRWVNTDSPFSTGQTVRIRVGPLKGYICRVISIYRSKVTVKLDSLVKIMTVNSNDLSEVAVKNVDDYMRNTSTMASFNQFGFQDGSSGDGSEAPPQKSSWDLDVPDTARDSWPGFSTSELSAPSDGDSKGGTDRWNSKLDRENETSSTLGCWDKGGNLSGGQNSSWNNGNGDSGVSMKEQNNIREKDASGTDMWNSKQKITNDDLSNGTDCWDKRTNSTGRQISAWNHASGHQIGISTNEQATWEKNAGSWKQNAGDDGSEAWGKDNSSQKDGKQQNPSGDSKDNWEKKTSKTHVDSWNAREKCASSSGTAYLAGEESNLNQQSNWNTSRADCKEKANSWDSKRKCILENDNGWGKPAASERKTSTTGDDGQAWVKACRTSNLSSSDANKKDSWDFKCKTVDGNEKDAWSKSSGSPRKGSGGENESWGKTLTASSRNSTSVGWKEDLQQNNVEYGAKLSETRHEQSDRWDKAATLQSIDQSDDWGKSKDKSTHAASQEGTWDSTPKKQEIPTSGDWSQSRSWEKTKVSREGFSGTWNKHDSAGEHDTGGWKKKETLNDGGADRWGKSEPPNIDWQQNRADVNYSERGRGLGRGRGRGYNSRGTSQGSNWGSGRGQSGDRNRCEQSDGTTWTGKSCDKWEGKGRDGWNSSSWGSNQPDTGAKSNSFGRGGGSATWNRNQGSDWNSMGKHIDEGTSKFDKPSWNNGRRNWNDANSTSASQSGWGQASAADKSVGGEAKWNVPKPSENPSSWNDDGDVWNKREKCNSDQPKSWKDKSTKSNFESETAAAKGVWDKDNSSADGKWGNPVDGISSGSAKISTKLNDAGISWEKAKFSGEKQSSCWNAEERVAETQNMSRDYGRDQPVKSDSGNTETKNDGWDVAKQLPQDESSPWDQKSSHATDSGWDRPKAQASAKDSKWNDKEGKSWSKGRDDDGNQSSSWNQSRGYDSGGHGGHRGGRTGNWNRGGRSNGGGGRGRNSNSDIGGTRKSYGSWNEGKNFGEEQPTGGGCSSLSGGWSTEKGILESPKPKPDWGSKGWGQSSFSSGMPSGDNDADKCSMGPPRSDGKWYSTSGLEKGSERWENARDRNSGEKQNVKGDCSNWNRTTGNDSWSRENTQPTGLEAVGNEGNAWGKVVFGNSGEGKNDRGDSSNSKRNSGRDSWSQEKPQPFGSETSVNERSPWGNGSGSSQAKDENISDRRNDGGDSSTCKRNAEGGSWGQEKSRPSGTEAPGNVANDWGKGSGSWEKANSSEKRNERDDSSNRNKNTGTDSWGQEKSQPSGSEPVRNGGNAWENAGGSWNKDKDQQSSGHGGW